MQNILGKLCGKLKTYFMFSTFPPRKSYRFLDNIEICGGAGQKYLVGPDNIEISDGADRIICWSQIT
jgi:hypothetical protein